MVECQIRQHIHRKPLCLGGIVTGYDLIAFLTHKCKKRHRDHTLARVAVHTAECLQLLDIDIHHSCFLAQFAQCSFFQRLVNSHKAARQSPFAFIRLQPSLYKQQIQPRAVESEHNAVGGQSRMWIFITIHFLPLIFQQYKFKPIFRQKRTIVSLIRKQKLKIDIFAYFLRIKFCCLFLRLYICVKITQPSIINY